jgi:1,4-dihydroxy-2-naphthoyl-CoA hydrolase
MISIPESLWARPLTLDEIRRRYLGGCDRHLGVELTAVGPDWIEGRVPTIERTRDPHGDNYGAAIAILAETLGSIAANLCVEVDKRGVGQSLEVHYFLPVTAGPITGRASPVSITGPTHTWRIDLRDEAETLVSTATLSIAIVEPGAAGSRPRDFRGTPGPLPD